MQRITIVFICFLFISSLNAQFKTNGKGKIEKYLGVEQTNIIIPDKIGEESIVEIGFLAFASKEITKVSFPNSVKFIESLAFFNNKIDTLVLPPNLKVIEDLAFANNNLKTLTIPPSVTKIGSGAFNNNAIIEVNGKSSNGLIFARNMDGTENRNIIVSYGGNSKVIDFIPVYVKHIGEFAFHKLKIISVNLPDSLISIGESAFSFNYLSTIIFPNKLQNIESRAFMHNSIERLIISNSILKIDIGAFNSNYIDSVIIEKHSRLKYLGAYAFSENKNLKSIMLPYDRSIQEFGWHDEHSNIVPLQPFVIYDFKKGYSTNFDHVDL